MTMRKRDMKILMWACVGGLLFGLVIGKLMSTAKEVRCNDVGVVDERGAYVMIDTENCKVVNAGVKEAWKSGALKNPSINGGMIVVTDNFDVMGVYLREGVEERVLFKRDRSDVIAFRKVK